TKLFEYATSTLNTIKPSPEYTTLTLVEDGYIITNNVMSRINCLNSDDTIIRDIHVCLEYNWSSIVNTIHEFTKTNTTTSTATNESNNSDTNNTDNNSSSTPSKSNNNSNTATSSTTTTTPKASLGGFFGGFAAALLDAVDDDLTDAPPSTTTSRYTSTIDKFLLTDDQKFDINVIKANSYNDALRILNTLNYTSTTNNFEESLNQVIKSTIRNELGERRMPLVFEPGRSIAANAGILLTRVEYLKQTPEHNFALVDAGMNDMIRPALYQAWLDIQPSRPAANGIHATWDIVGPVCETGDFLGKQRTLALEEGSLLAMFGAGAYGFSMSSNYNTRPRAAEIMVDGNAMHIAGARETLDDLLRRERRLPD
ncbi:MAG: hypothetical protein NWS56_00680, partial [Haliea sp.]|nr:hypothetical protein [Haliea sp.]